MIAKTYDNVDLLCPGNNNAYNGVAIIKTLILFIYKTDDFFPVKRAYAVFPCIYLWQFVLSTSWKVRTKTQTIETNSKVASKTLFCQPTGLFYRQTVKVLANTTESAW